MFTLDPQLQQDTIELGSLPLCLVLLAKDANYPWCILVPKREGLREIHQLKPADRQQLLEESCHLSEIMEQMFNPTKMNVAALGNRVSQLHVHHIARFTEDSSWPKPIWGQVPAIPYSKAKLESRVHQIQSKLGAGPLSFDLAFIDHQ